MKRSLLLFIVLIALSGMIKIHAQDQENKTEFLLPDKIVLSGFGSPFVEFSSVNDQFAVCLGGGAALMINQTVFIGGYFEGITTNHYMDELQSIVNLEKPKVSFEHGGIWLGYVYKPKKAIHGGLSMKLGWGEIDLGGDEFANGTEPVYDYRDRIFSIIPQVEFEVNMTEWLKINIGVGYRFITGIDATYTDEQNDKAEFYNKSDFNSPTGTIAFIFGGFNKKE